MIFESDSKQIMEAYQKRKDSVPVDLYSPAKPVNIYYNFDLLRNLLPTMANLGVFPFNDRRILDIGCGRGNWLCTYLQWGAKPENIHGIDLDEERLKIAQSRLPQSDIREGDASNLPWENGRFDIVFQFTAFTSMLNPVMRQAVASEMIRVLKPGGIIIWYDFRYSNPSNKDVVGLGLSEIHKLFEPAWLKARLLTLAPPIARRIIPVSLILGELLRKIPFLRTHYLVFIKPEKLKP